MQRILRVGDDQGMCRGSLENSECELPWQLKCEGTARIPPWACVCPVHVPTVPWHSIIQHPTAEGPRLVWGAPAGSQRGFHKSIQEQREWNWISRGRSVSLALVYVKVVTLGSLESCLQCFYVDTEFTRHWGWPCQENSLQMKYNTSKIFGEMLEMVILKCISKTWWIRQMLKATRIWKVSDSSLHTHVMQIHVKGDRKSVSLKTV